MNKQINELQKMIEQMHECNSQFVESVSVVETFSGQVVWQGIIYVFLLEGHPLATDAMLGHLQ